MSLKAFLTMAEVAEQTGLSLPTLRRYRHEDRGPKSFRIAGRVVYPYEAVAEWLEAEMAASARGGA